MSEAIKSEAIMFIQPPVLEYHDTHSISGLHEWRGQSGGGGVMRSAGDVREVYLTLHEAQREVAATCHVNGYV